MIEITAKEQVLVKEISTNVVELTAPGPQGPAAPSLPRSITIARPQSVDKFTIFRTSASALVTAVIGVVSSGAVEYVLKYGADRSASGTAITTTSTVTSTSTGDAATVIDAALPANVFVWIEVTSVTGVIDEFNLSVAF